MKLTFQTLLISLLLSACSNAPVQGVILATTTSTATPQSTETPQPTRMPTLPATATTESKKIIAITETHIAEISAEATVSAYGTICKPPASDYYARISPDGHWIAMACKGKDGEIDSHLRVINLQGDKNWSIHYTDYANGGYYDTRNTIYPVHWSIDGKYLYVASESTGSGCCWVGWSVLLIRLNLENGQQAEVANYIDEVPGMNFSFSPSEKYVLFIPQDGNNKLYILDTHKWKQRVIKLEDTGAGAGHTLMSNDDKKIILVLRDHPKEYQSDLTFGSLVVIDLESGSQKKILSDIEYEELPLPVSWKDSDHVLLRNDNEFLLLNITTGELTKTEYPY